MRYYHLFLLLFICSCTSTDESARKMNLKGEYLFRKEKDVFFALSPPLPQERAAYPWEKKIMGKYPRITKEFFRCKGNPFNPVIVKKKEGKEDVFFRDCSGPDHHGLPLREGEEFVYPCLVTLLNYIQEKTSKRVVITTGHRCPEHNTYCDHSPSNFGSKHMLGAEVDFYVEGMETEGEKIVALLQEFYKGQKEYEKFERYEKTDLMTKPWYNKEIFIKLYRESEGRDFDNQHSYPYIGLQVRYDREHEMKVTFEEKATKNYLRY